MTLDLTAQLAVRRSGRNAGIGLLVLAALSGFGVFVATRALDTDGDAARTAQRIAESEGLFRAGILSLCIVVVLDVIVAAELYRFLRPVHDGMARLVAWLRVAYAAGFLVAIVQLFGAVRLVEGAAGGAGASQRDADVLSHMEAFGDTYQAALLLFAVHLLLLGYLTSRSHYVPRAIGALLAIAGLGYAFDSVATILSGDLWNVSAITFVGEAVLALWLVLRWSRITVPSPQARAIHRPEPHIGAA